MYKCKKCGEVSEAGVPRLLLINYRDIKKYSFDSETGTQTEIGSRREIAKETPVCRKCYREFTVVPK